MPWFSNQTLLGLGLLGLCFWVVYNILLPLIGYSITIVLAAFFWRTIQNA